jgi:hypothetical protein
LKANFHHAAITQLFEKLQPLPGRQIILYVTSACEMATVLAAQIAPAGNFEID